MNYSIQNIDYVSQFFSKKDVRRVAQGYKLSENKRKTQYTIKTMLSSMERYGDNRWWLSDDETKVFYYQMKEKTLLLPVERFISLINSQLGESIESLDDLSKRWESIKKA